VAIGLNLDLLVCTLAKVAIGLNLDLLVCTLAKVAIGLTSFLDSLSKYFTMSTGPLAKDQ
jgi:hypothetical protein